MVQMSEKDQEDKKPAFNLPGFKVALVGDSGTGKTHALRTLVEAGLEVFAVFTEPGMDVVSDIPSDRLHWNYISPSTVSWDKLYDSARKINTLSFKALAEMPHINRGEHAEFLTVVNTMANYIDQRTGTVYGEVDSFDQTRCIYFDSLSGLNTMAMNLVAGSKPIKNPGDYGTSMDNLENFIQKLTQDLRCHVVMTCHLERVKDEMTGGTSMMISTIGQKLAPKLTKLFTDVIHSKRVERDFSWSTVTPNMTLKARNIPWADEMKPTFVPLYQNWLARNEQAGK